MLKEIQLYKHLKNISLPEPLAVFKSLNYNFTEYGIKFTAQLSEKIEIIFIQGQITTSTEQVPPVYGHVFIEAKSEEVTDKYNDLSDAQFKRLIRKQYKYIKDVAREGFI